MCVHVNVAVPFTLSEVLDSTSNRRLTFANGGSGTFVISGPGLAMSDDQMVMVIPLVCYLQYVQCTFMCMQCILIVWWCLLF